VDKRISSFAELLGQCEQSNEPRDWEALVAFLQPIVGGVVARSARRWGANAPEIVEDLTQEAFLKLCRNRFALLRKTSEQTEEACLAYVRATVANLVHDHFRAELSAKRAPKAGFLQTEFVEDWMGQTHTVDATERKILLDEIDQILINRLAGDTARRDRRIFWLHHRLGMTAKAIATLPGMGLSTKGIESVLFRLNVLVKEELAVGEGISNEGTFL
jgi:RNA polymerase sigma factor (sigma-70 family)